MCEGIAGIPVETREIYHPFVTGGQVELKRLFLENTKLYEHTNLKVLGVSYL